MVETPSSAETLSPRGSLEKLYREFSPVVFRLALRILSSRPEAEDATHDVFLQVYEDWPSFRGKSAPKTWIYQIAVNHCLNRLRRRRALKFVPWSLFRRAPEPTETSPENPPVLLALLDRLSPKLRSAVVLKDVEGLSYEEVAQALEIAPGTAMSRVARGREELRVLFSKSTEENG